jgi:hypothetical protein
VHVPRPLSIHAIIIAVTALPHSRAKQILHCNILRIFWVPVGTSALTLGNWEAERMQEDKWARHTCSNEVQAFQTHLHAGDNAFLSICTCDL